MIRYIVVTILISVTLVNAYKAVSPGKRYKQEIETVAAYDDDYDSEFDYTDYAKEVNTNSKLRPWTISYWGNLLRKTRFPSLNITNPFTKLFSPYVIKIDFPPGTDPNLQPVKNPNKNKNPLQPDYIYINTASNDGEPEQDDTHYFYDPVTQQYYEVVESTSQDYNPENNYYATTFKDDDEIEINLDDAEDKHVIIQSDESDASVDEDNRRELKGPQQYIVGIYDEPTVKKSKTKHAREGVRNIMQRRPLMWLNQQLI